MTEQDGLIQRFFNAILKELSGIRESLEHGVRELRGMRDDREARTRMDALEYRDEMDRRFGNHPRRKVKTTAEKDEEFRQARRKLGENGIPD